MIKISNVDKYFNDVKIIDDCNLIIKSGELTIIAGGDGAARRHGAAYFSGADRGADPVLCFGQEPVAPHRPAAQQAIY
jgi:ABC-type sugar transport system ATPase subunit